MNRSFLQLIKTMKHKRVQKKEKKSKKSKYEQEYLNESVENAENQSSGSPAECENREHEAKTETHSAMTEFDRTEKNITPAGGFPHMEDNLLIKGCSVEPKKRVMTILRLKFVEPMWRPALKINLKFIDPYPRGCSCHTKFYGRTSRF